jgi:septal ring factor EnvC (AmiA/AmiB activator)
MAATTNDSLSDIIKTLDDDIKALRAEQETYNREKLTEILDFADSCSDNDPRIEQMVLEHKEGLALLTRKLNSRIKLIVS